MLAISLALAVAVGNAAPQSLLLVLCSPGSPGTTEDAQPRLDAFASALSTRARTQIHAIYEPTDAGGVKRIAGAALAIVSLPFFVAHEKDLGLHPRLVVVQEGRPALESWVLVAQKGRIARGEQLAGFTIVSSAAFAPGFVRGAVEAAIGALPAGVRLVQSTAVVSSLRRAANGEGVAVLLDGVQAAALGSLPFAGKLDVVGRSPAWPAGIVVTVGAKLSAAEWKPIESALLGLATDRDGAAALSAMRIDKFEPLDAKALERARRAYTP